jgi:hypothetical protein
MIKRSRFFPSALFAAALLISHSALAQFSLTPLPGLPAIFSGSLAWADYDNDGRLDFLISGNDATTGKPTLLLWRNTGAGFTDVTATTAPGLQGILDGSVAWGDFDNDGRLDFLIAGLTNTAFHGAICQVWRNTESGFTNVPIPDLPGVSESSVAWSDFDNDGRLDFLITGTTNGDLSGVISQLWRNTGTGFTNVPVPGLLGTGFGSATWTDFDNDGRPDFLVTGNQTASQLWRNTGTGFTNVPVPGLPAVFVSSVSWGDYDNDGLLDFLFQGFTTNAFVFQLWHNTGTGFSNVAIPGLPGVADGTLAWADYDNDGLLDFLTTGLTNGDSRISQLWRNTGAGFSNVPIPGLAGNFDNSLGWADFDNDSRLDFLIAGNTAGGFVSQLWRNTGPASNSPPAAPAGLSATVSGTSVVLHWNPPADDHTPSAGLSYNVRIGTTPGGSEIVSAPALSNGVLRLPRLGTARNGSAMVNQLPPGRTYYWSVQAVDSGFLGSAFAAEQQFTVLPMLINPVHNANGSFQFTFAAAPGSTFTALATTNISLPLTNWTTLGTPVEISPGLFQFTDSQAPANSQRFYTVRKS